MDLGHHSVSWVTVSAEAPAHAHPRRGLGTDPTKPATGGMRDSENMGICGNYAKHHWTRAARLKDNVCVRCGLPFMDRDEALFESQPQPLVRNLPNAKTTRKDKLLPLVQIVLKGHSG